MHPARALGDHTDLQKQLQIPVFSGQLVSKSVHRHSPEGCLAGPLVASQHAKTRLSSQLIGIEKWLDLAELQATDSGFLKEGQLVVHVHIKWQVSILPGCDVQSELCI